MGLRSWAERMRQKRAEWKVRREAANVPQFAMGGLVPRMYGRSVMDDLRDGLRCAVCGEFLHEAAALGDNGEMCCSAACAAETFED